MGISFRISKIGKKFRSNTSKSPSHPVEKPSLSDVAPYKILPSKEVYFIPLLYLFIVAVLLFASIFYECFVRGDR